MMNENLQPAPGSLSTQIFPLMPCTKEERWRAQSTTDFPFREGRKEIVEYF